MIWNLLNEINVYKSGEMYMNYKFEEQLCFRLRDVFASVLNVLYEDNEEIPNYLLTFIFDYQDTYTFYTKLILQEA